MPRSDLFLICSTFREMIPVMTDDLPDQPRKGRGAISNRSSRFDTLSRTADDDGWRREAEEPAPLPTRLISDTPRSVITRNESPDIPFDRSINPYRGCEHGCAYCFARPSHAWLGLSPGLDFETVIVHKANAAAVLERQLRAPGYVPAPIAIGSVTDAYQPVERHLGLTRAILDVLEAFRHPLTIVTKSALVLRDRDVLARMAGHGLAQVSVSVTTLDRDLARRLEPRAATPSRRLDVIGQLASAGVPVTVLVSPLIPGLTDHELESILGAAAEAGARSAATMVLRLPGEVADLFAEWLTVHAPGSAARVLNRIRDCRAGELDDRSFGRRMRGSGAHADLIAARYRRACSRLGLATRWAPLTTALFRPPPAPGDQLSLF